MVTLPKPTKVQQNLALDSAEELHDALERIDGPGVLIEIEQAGLHLNVPKAALRMLVKILQLMAKAKVVQVAARADEVTTQVAADMLNVSRPYVIKLLEEGKIPYTKVGRHRRIRFEDVLVYKKEMQRTTREGLAEMMSIDEKYGLHDA